jgi:hypothetical protein
MKRIRLAGTVWAMATVALLSGCLQSDDGLTSNTTEDAEDESSLEGTVNLGIPDYADPDVFFYDLDPLTGSGRTDGEPIRWWREVLNVDKTIEIHITKPETGPHTASVDITKNVSGILHVVEEGDVTVDRFKKNFENQMQRSLYFERRGPPVIHPRRGWRLKAITGASIASPGTTRQIHSVRIQADGVDETVTNVTELVRVRDLLRLPPHSEVTVTVDTADDTDQVYFHLKRHRMRFPMASNTDGTFTGAFVTGRGPGPRHIVIDVLAHATLNDEAAPYDNVAWGIPYLIVGEDDAIGDGSNGDDGEEDD